MCGPVKDGSMRMALLKGLVAALVIAGGQGGSVAAVEERPRVFLDAAEVQELRRDIAGNPWKHRIYDGPMLNGPVGKTASAIKPQADDLLDRDITIPARGGHYHHFFCECGTQLEYPEDMEPKPETGYTCPACGKNHKGEKLDAAVRREQHMALAHGVLFLGLAYQVEQDEKYAAKAAEILRKYAEAYPEPHTSQLEGGIIYQSLCESIWLIPLAAGYDLVYSSVSLSDADRQTINDKLIRPAAEGIASVGVGGNWHSWHLSAVGVAGYAIGDQKLIDYGLSEFRKQIANELGDDGLWPESVHTYHFFPLQAFCFLAEAAMHNGVDLYNWEARPGKSLKAMFTSPLAYAYPNLQMPAINDGWFRVFLPPHMYELAYARLGGEELAWAVQAGYEAQGWERFGVWSLLRGKNLPSNPQPPAMRSMNFPVLGIAALKSPGGAMMTFDYGPFMGHGQLDKMGITLYANDRLWAADYGTPGYGSPIITWYTGTASHNTVLVDGKYQERTQEKILNFMQGGPRLEAVQSETEQAYPGVKHTRTIVRADDAFIVIDDLAGSSSHTYDFFFRSEGDMSIAAPGAIPTDEAPAYDRVETSLALKACGPWQCQWTVDRERLVLFAPVEDESTVFQSTCPAETGMRRVGLVISRKTGLNARFVHVLVAAREGEDVRVGMEGPSLVIRRGTTEDWVALEGAHGRLTTDAQYAMVRLKDGRPALAALVAGKTVHWDGRLVLEETGSGRWAQKSL